jgi:hypothetical protein
MPAARSSPVTGANGEILDLLKEIPWGQNLLILKKLTNPAARIWYLRATARFGWSRNVLLNQIKAGAYERAVNEKKTHNFPLVAAGAPRRAGGRDAQEQLQPRISRHQECREGAPTRGAAHLPPAILPARTGLRLLLRRAPTPLALGKKEYFIDLLFYHRFLKALVAFDLKVGPFEPEHAGKMDFYLNLLNDKERGPDDQPSIGIILCAEKDDVEVEYALRTKANPIGVAVYELQSQLPGELKGKLPTTKQLADVVRVEMEGGE